MTTASIVLYHSNINELNRVLDCAIKSCIETIYLIDNSAHDDLRALATQSSKLVYIYNNANLGYGKAHNIAIRQAIEIGSKYHIVINPDIIFEPDALVELIEYMNDHEVVGQLLPKVNYPNGDLQYLCKLIPTPTDLIFKRFLSDKRKKKRMERFQLRFTGYNDVMNVPYLSGCFMFFRTSALKDIGLFDERFFMYPEDIDITRRMHEKYETHFYPKVSIIHAHAAESYRSKKMLWIHITNMIKYFNKWGWIFDKKRNIINRKVLKELGYKE